jgi:hypothetical protein
MSLEQAITDHAAALRELAAAIRATVGASHEITAAAADKAISDAKSTAASKPQASVVTKPAEEVKATAAALAAETAPTYDAVKDRVIALSKEKGREPTIALLQRHGVTKAPELKPAQYADFIADVDALLAGTYDAEASEIA